jgi:hypothetical protein
VKSDYLFGKHGARLSFTSDAWRSMQGFRQARTAAPEASGALLGRHLLRSEDIVVDSVTTPQPGDRRSRTRFFRSRRHASLAFVRGRRPKERTTVLGFGTPVRSAGWRHHGSTVSTGGERLKTADSPARTCPLSSSGLPTRLGDRIGTITNLERNDPR